MGLIDSLTSTFRSVTNGLNGAGLAPFDHRSNNPSPCTYALEVWSPDGTRPATTAELGAAKPMVAFRLPPASFQMEQAVRSDVLQDLSGGAMVVDGGLGLARISMGGTHGVGRSRDGAAMAATGTGELSPALDRVMTIRDFFEAWATQNAGKKSSEKLQMALHITGGSWSDYSNEVFLVWPQSIPSASRDASRPHAWNWNLSLWVLGNPVRSAGQIPEPPTTAQQFQKLSKLQQFVQDAARLARAIIAPVQDLANKMAGLNASVKALRDAGIREVSGLGDAISQVALAADGILASTKPANVFDDATAAYRAALIDTRKTVGDARRWGTTDGLSGRAVSAAVPKSAPVAPGSDIQTVVAAQTGSVDGWQDAAAANGLKFPFTSATIASTPAASPYPGVVLAPGQTLNIPTTLTPNAGPVDLVGRDMDPAGQKGVLIGGAQNLQNALLRRLATPLGWLPHRPAYGSRLRELLGRPLDLSAVVGIRQEVARVFQADARVLAIQQLSVDVQGEQVVVKAQLQTVLGLVGFGGAVTPVGG